MRWGGRLLRALSGQRVRSRWHKSKPRRRGAQRHAAHSHWLRRITPCVASTRTQADLSGSKRIRLRRGSSHAQVSLLGCRQAADTCAPDLAPAEAGESLINFVPSTVGLQSQRGQTSFVNLCVVVGAAANRQWKIFYFVSELRKSGWQLRVNLKCRCQPYSYLQMRENQATYA